MRTSINLYIAKPGNHPSTINLYSEKCRGRYCSGKIILFLKTLKRSQIYKINWEKINGKNNNWFKK